MTGFRHLRIKDLEALASKGGTYRGPQGPSKGTLMRSKLPPEAPISHFAHEEEVVALVRMVEADPALAVKAEKMEGLRKDMDEAETGIVETMRKKAVKALAISAACGGAILAAVHYLKEDLAYMAVGLSVMFAVVAANIFDKGNGEHQRLEKKMEDAEAGLKELS
jgi:uncharacterized membrane protein